MPRLAKTLVEIQSYARSFDRAAINVLAGIMRQKTAPAAARVNAANSLLDRGWGKAEQDHTLNAEIQITIRRLLDGPALPISEDQQPVVIDVTPQPQSEVAGGLTGTLPVGRAGKRTHKMGPGSDVTLAPVQDLKPAMASGHGQPVRRRGRPPKAKKP